jgi:cytochrome b
MAALVPASWWTAEEGHMEVHAWLGYTMLVAVATRLCWGFVGSRHARFADFLRGPRAVLATLGGRDVSRTPGHNPAGGWSALVLWALVLAQALTGTVNSDDVLFDGPFHYLFDSGTADALAALHEPLFNVLLAFVALHVLAIVYYERLRDKRLLRPMITGTAAGRYGEAPPKPLYRALLIAVVLAGVLWGLIALAPEPPSSSYW